MITTDAAFIAELVEYLADHGYRVTRARAPRSIPDQRGRQRVRKSGKQHGTCIEHYRIPGMREPVCILGVRVVDGVQLPPQSADEVLAFAAEIVAIAASAGDVPKASRVARVALAAA